VYQIVLNHDWGWATPEPKIWHFSPFNTVEIEIIVSTVGINKLKRI
jgi:hypothetical protein